MWVAATTYLDEYETIELQEDKKALVQDVLSDDELPPKLKTADLLALLD